jgi:replication-associated recombination protein RarA
MRMIQYSETSAMESRERGVLGYAACAEYDDLFPEALGRQSFYNPPERGFEREIRKRLEYWARLRRERTK